MYRAIALTSFQAQLAYRSQVWASLFGELVVVFARIAIWTSVYAGIGVVGGVSLTDMVGYSVIGGTVAMAWYPIEMIYLIGRSLRSGDVSVFLIKPLHYPAYTLATEFGKFVYRAVTVVAPVLLIVGLVIGFPPPSSWLDALAFPVFWALGFGITFSMAAICGILAFWMMTAFSLEWFLSAAISIFSGTFIPFWFFPEPLGAMLTYQPFAWTAYYPAAVYLGKLEPTALLAMFALGLFWLAILVCCVLALWRASASRISIQGG